MINGLKTNINELRFLINDYKEQLKRLKVSDVDNYPLILNIRNDSLEEDDWEFDIIEKVK
jgi:hypothetical protein